MSIAVHIRLIDHDVPGPGESVVGEWDEPAFDLAAGLDKYYDVGGTRWVSLSHYIETGSRTVVVTARRR